MAAALLSIPVILALEERFLPGLAVRSDELTPVVTVIVPYFLILALVRWVIRRRLRVSYSRITERMLVLNAPRHDDVLAEMERRRIAQLRYQAEPDPLAYLPDYRNLLGIMKAEELLTEEEAQSLLTRTRAMQKALGALDENHSMPEALRKPDATEVPLHTIH